MTRTADVRRELAAILEAALPGWSIYPEPPAGVVAPAVAVAPGEPYRTTTAYRMEEVQLRLLVLLSAGATGALDLLDDAIELVLLALMSQPTNAATPLAVRQVGSVGLIQDIGGVQLLSATVDVTATIERSR